MRSDRKISEVIERCRRNASSQTSSNLDIIKSKRCWNAGRSVELKPNTDTVVSGSCSSCAAEGASGQARLRKSRGRKSCAGAVATNAESLGFGSREGKWKGGRTHQEGAAQKRSGTEHGLGRIGGIIRGRPSADILCDRKELSQQCNLPSHPTRRKLGVKEISG